MPEKTGQCLVSADCVFDASLVPGTCLHRFVDLKGFIQQVPGESFIVQIDGIRRKLPITLFWIVGSEEARLRASFCPPPKLHVRFARMQLSRRHMT